MIEDDAQAPSELQDWMSAWQGPPAAPGETHRDAELAARIEKVKRSSHHFGLGLLALTISEILFGLVALVAAAFWLAQQPMPFKWITFGLICVFVVAAEFLVLKNRRGTYRPKNQTTQAFIELEWLRGRRQLNTIRWLIPFVVVEILAIGGLRIWEMANDPHRAARLPELILSLLLFITYFFLAFLPFLWFWRRHVQRKMKELEPLREAFAQRLEPR